MKTMVVLFILTLTQSLFPVSSLEYHTQKHSAFHQKSISYSASIIVDEITPEAESTLVEYIPLIIAVTFSSTVAPETFFVRPLNEKDNSFLKYISLFITSPPAVLA